MTDAAVEPEANGHSEEPHSEDGPDRGMPSREGRRVVLTVYVGVVLLAGVMGVSVGLFLGGSLEPISILGLVTVPPSPTGFALYGIVTVAVALGVPLALVTVFSRRLEDVDRS